jgi:hypothetical protein
MKPGTDVREKITGRTGVVMQDGRTLFPSLKGYLKNDGTYDDGLRDIPNNQLEKIKLEVDSVMEAVANVLQTER